MQKQEKKKNLRPAKTKMKKLETEESKVVKRFILVLVIVVVCVVGIYFLTRIFVTKDLFNKKEETTTTSSVDFNYEKTILGSAFNRPYSEYYILVYKNSDEQSTYLSSLVTDYQAKDEHLKLYTADLDDYMNQDFYDKDNVNPNATKASELKVGDYTLIKIKDKKINKYIQGIDEITEELK